MTIATKSFTYHNIHVFSSILLILILTHIYINPEFLSMNII